MRKSGKEGVQFSEKGIECRLAHDRNRSAAKALVRVVGLGGGEEKKSLICVREERS